MLTKQSIIPKQRRTNPITQKRQTGSNATALKPFSEIPSVDGFQWINGLKVMDTIGTVKGIEDVKKYGELFRCQILSKKFVVISSPQLVQEFMSYEPAMPSGIASDAWPLKWQKELLKKIDRPNDLLETGPVWKEARDYFQKDMFPPKESQFYFPHIDRSAVAVVDQFEDLDPLELQDVLMKVSFELFHGFMFGRPSGVFEKDCDPDYLEMLSSSQKFVSSIARLMRRQKWMKIFPSVKKDLKILEENTIISSNAWDRIGHKNIQKILKEKDSLSLTSYLAKLSEKSVDFRTTVQGTGTFLSAAVDTTSTALIWLLYHTASNPKKQEELFQQLDQVLKGKGITCQEDADSVPLLNGFVKESQRLTPVAAGTMREFDFDVSVNGYTIPAGTVAFLMPSIYVGRDEKVFQNPTSFEPERWSPEAKKLRRKNKESFPHDSPFTLMQFSIGARMCLGARIAHVELLTILSRLIQKYQISFVEGSTIPDINSSKRDSGLTLPDPYPQLKFTKRN